MFNFFRKLFCRGEGVFGKTSVNGTKKVLSIKNYSNKKVVDSKEFIRPNCKGELESGKNSDKTPSDSCCIVCDIKKQVAQKEERKIVPKEVLSISDYSNKEVVVSKEFICPNCRWGLETGRRSNKTPSGSYYVVCNSCSFVSKISNSGVVIVPANTPKEIKRAYQLFESKPNRYKMQKYSESKSFDF